jgi:hypothetical protein
MHTFSTNSQRYYSSAAIREWTITMVLTQSIQSTQIHNPVNCTAMHWVRRVTYLGGAGRYLERAVELSSDVAADEPRRRCLWRRLDFLLLRTADRTS